MTAAGGLLAAGREGRDVALDRLDGPSSDDDSSADDLDDDVRPEPPIEPGTPSPENSLFVLLGILVALAVVARLVQLFG